MTSPGDIVSLDGWGAAALACDHTRSAGLRGREMEEGDVALVVATATFANDAWSMLLTSRAEVRWIRTSWLRRWVTAEENEARGWWRAVRGA